MRQMSIPYIIPLFSDRSQMKSKYGNKAVCNRSSYHILTSCMICYGNMKSINFVLYNNEVKK